MISWEEYRAMIQANIDDSGRCVQGVAANPSFYYTIGHTIRGLPELLLIGNLNPKTATGILNFISVHMFKSEAALPEGIIDVGLKLPIKVRKAGDLAKGEYTVQAGNYHGSDDYDVLQILFCDRAGKYPGDWGVDPEFDVPCP